MTRQQSNIQSIAQSRRLFGVRLTVGTNTQVDLLLEGVGLESFGDTKNGVLLTELR